MSQADVYIIGQNDILMPRGSSRGDGNINEAMIECSIVMLNIYCTPPVLKVRWGRRILDRTQFSVKK